MSRDRGNSIGMDVSQPVVVLAVMGLPGTGKSTLCGEVGKQLKREPVGPYSESIIVYEEVPHEELALFLSTKADPETGYNKAAMGLQLAFLRLRETSLAKAMRRAIASDRPTLIVEDRGMAGDAAMALGVLGGGAMSASEYASYSSELRGSMRRLHAEFGQFPYVLVNLRMGSPAEALARCHKRGSAGESVYDETYFRNLSVSHDRVVLDPPSFVTLAVHEDWARERPVDTDADRAALPVRAVIARALCGVACV